MNKWSVLWENIQHNCENCWVWINNLSIWSKECEYCGSAFFGLSETKEGGLLDNLQESNFSTQELNEKCISPFGKIHNLSVIRAIKHYKEINYILGVNRRIKLDDINGSFEMLQFEIKSLYKAILQSPFLDNLTQGWWPIEDYKWIYGA